MNTQNPVGVVVVEDKHDLLVAEVLLRSGECQSPEPVEIDATIGVQIGCSTPGAGVLPVLWNVVSKVATRLVHLPPLIKRLTVLQADAKPFTSASKFTKFVTRARPPLSRYLRTEQLSYAPICTSHHYRLTTVRGARPTTSPRCSMTATLRFSRLPSAFCRSRWAFSVLRLPTIGVAVDPVQCVYGLIVVVAPVAHLALQPRD